MRRILTIICALIVMALLPAALWVSRILPADSGPYIAQKYAGWSGVLQAWVCCEWKPGSGSFTGWLNECAARFERAHPGVYIEFTPVDRAAMAVLSTGGIRPPELAFFSPGVIGDGGLLLEQDLPPGLRSELRRDSRALPVAMGGTIWAVNPESDGPALVSGESLPGAIPLLSAQDEAAPIEPIDPALDLGLPAFSPTVDGDALERFISGEAVRIPVTQAELARLHSLQESGRGPAWVLEGGGAFACADQLLLAGVPCTAGGEQAGLAMEFIHLLLEEESQSALAQRGAFAVMGETIHPGHSPYAPLDALLNGLPLAAPDWFSEHSAGNPADIVRGLSEGIYSARETAAKFGLKLSAPN